LIFAQASWCEALFVIVWLLHASVFENSHEVGLKLHTNVHNRSTETKLKKKALIEATIEGLGLVVPK